MVVALGPGKFYGSSLPRPRIYTDVKLNNERVNPPTPVMDPLMSWAEEAHWSMGGLSFKRHRLQGRIEGNVDRLRAQREKTFKKSQKENRERKYLVSESQKRGKGKAWSLSPSISPPPAPLAKKRRIVGLVDEDEENVENESGGEIKRGAVRKLGDDFERVARESGMAGKKGSPAKNASVGGGKGLTTRTRSKQKEVENNEKTKKGRKLMKGGKGVGAKVVAAVASGLRSSPRLASRVG